MGSLLHHSVVLLTAVLVAGAFAVRPASAEGQDPALPPIVAYYDFARVGTPAFSLVVPTAAARLSGEDERRARLDYVAHLREVLDAPPDLPPGSFDRLLSFAAYFIPEVNGYLIASVFDATVFPVQLFDVLHLHAKGRNDWGRSLRIRVEEVHRNDRLALGTNPALTVDVRMSGGLDIASLYVQVPSPFNRIGGLTLLLPASNREALQPLVTHIRDSIRVGASDDPPQPELGVFRIAALGEESVPPPGIVYEANIAGGSGRLWNPPNPDDEAIAGAAVLTALIVIAVAYPLIFFLTLRLLYAVIFLSGRFLTAAIDLEAYRKAAEANPWTMGLLRTERMIMLTALVSMGMAAALLALILRQF